MRFFIAIIAIIVFASCQKDEIPSNGFFEVGPRIDTATGKPIYTIFLPAAFTPNGDGLNDTYMAKGYGFDTNFKLEVYNTHNDLVFFSDNPNMGWDGRANHGGTIAPQGQYLFKASFTDIDGVNRSGSGTVSMTK